MIVPLVTKNMNTRSTSNSRKKATASNLRLHWSLEWHVSSPAWRSLTSIFCLKHTPYCHSWLSIFLYCLMLCCVVMESPLTLRILYQLLLLSPVSYTTCTNVIFFSSIQFSVFSTFWILFSFLIAVKDFKYVSFVRMFSVMCAVWFCVALWKKGKVTKVWIALEMSSVAIFVTNNLYSVVNLTKGLPCSFFLSHLF